ncbi:MAG: lytic transglycosylase domain-containing protein [Deltaproteobacteria bacterium]|nr:lytic transglycosylase domain-containing protein [Deltaproteobacteria bacterium]
MESPGRHNEHLAHCAAMGGLLARIVLVALGAGAAGAIPAGPVEPVRAIEVAGAHLPEPAVRAANALRAGASAREPAGAAERYAAAALAEPAVAARARRLEARAWLAAGRPAEAERAARSGLAASPASADVLAGLYEALGAARRAAGDEAGARSAWAEALQSGPDAELRATLRLRLGESLLAAGATEAAIVPLRALWIEAPEREEARVAGERLAALGPEPAAPLGSAADRRARADRLYALQRSEAALAEYDAALAIGASGSEQAHARRRRADCLFRLRRYAEAEAAFAALGDDPEARLWRARAQARRGAVEGAVAALEALGREQDEGTSAWARQLAGQLHAGRGRSDRARTLFASVAGDPSASDAIASDALRQLAWSAWRAGDPREAQARFAALAARQRDPIEQLEARYWEARARGGEGGARALAALAGEYPFSYYGWRAAQQGETAPVTPPPVPPGTRALDGAALLAARILVAAGLTDEARAELRALDGRAAGLDDRLALATLHAAAGDWSGAQGLVVSAYGERLARGPVNGPPALWRLAWPEAYPEALAAAQLADGAEPALVRALMREESRYEPGAISVTGALGLLQVMPDTGARLARELGMADFAAPQLLDPPTNLRLGSAYLASLLRRFDGALAPAVASYNAGPGPVAEWLAAGPRAEDEWVDAIPYTETRAYVKRVLRSRHAYRTLAP